MFNIYDLLVLLHLVGLSLGLGAATVKMALVLKSNADPGFLAVYFKVAKIITKFIVAGIIILTLSGIGWLIYGYSFTPLFIVKLVMVGLMWLLGPIIDNAIEPRLVKSAPKPGDAATPDFVRIRKTHLVMEIMATALMYAITIVGVML